MITIVKRQLRSSQVFTTLHTDRLMWIVSVSALTPYCYHVKKREDL